QNLPYASNAFHQYRFTIISQNRKKGLNFAIASSSESPTPFISTESLTRYRSPTPFITIFDSSPNRILRFITNAVHHHLRFTSVSDSSPSSMHPISSSFESGFILHHIGIYHSSSFFIADSFCI
ncbi:hypothetical protein L195_g060036, partial [Trifolium pratense]